MHWVRHKHYYTLRKIAQTTGRAYMGTTVDHVSNSDAGASESPRGEWDASCVHSGDDDMSWLHTMSENL